MNTVKSWTDLPLGARAALDEQWAGLAAGGLPCGSAIVDARGVVAVGRNRAYDAAGAIHTRMQHPLQHTRLAHAELNALAHVPTETDHASLTLWSTQHPCAMCAAAIAFVGIGRVRYVADDPSDASSPADNIASRKGIDYQPLGDPLWWTISNLLFLYNSAAQDGAEARNLRINRDRYRSLVELTLELAQDDALGAAARLGTSLPNALAPYQVSLLRVSGEGL